jgi:hypothetical protein
VTLRSDGRKGTACPTGLALYFSLGPQRAPPSWCHPLIYPDVSSGHTPMSVAGPSLACPHHGHVCSTWHASYYSHCLSCCAQILHYIFLLSWIHTRATDKDDVPTQMRIITITPLELLHALPSYSSVAQQRCQCHLLEIEPQNLSMMLRTGCIRTCRDNIPALHGRHSTCRNRCTKILDMQMAVKTHRHKHPSCHLSTRKTPGTKTILFSDGLLSETDQATQPALQSPCK